MKQCLLILLLTAVLLATAPGCRKRPSPTEEETTRDDAITLPSGSTGDFSDTDSNTPSAPPAQELVASSVQDLLFNEKPYFPDGQADKALADADHTLTIAEGIQTVSLTLVGWVGYNQSVDSFGYIINGGDPVFGNFSLPAEEEAISNGGEYTLGYRITAPLFDLHSGTHTVTFVVRLANGSVTEVYTPITLVLNGPVTDTAFPYHAALTHINGKGPGTSSAYQDCVGSRDSSIITVSSADDVITVSDDGTLRVSGWLALEGGVDHYAWSADGLTWHAITDSGVSGEPSDGYFAGLGYKSATEHALLRDLVLDLSIQNGQAISLVLGGVPNANTEAVVPFLIVKDLFIPHQPADIAFSHTVQAQDNSVGTDLNGSTLTELFTMRYGAGDIHDVRELNGVSCFAYEGIHSFQSGMDGRYAMTVSIESMTGCSFFFVRGTQVVRSVVPVNLPLDNYFETDGTSLCGGAGIYVQMADGTLTVVIKGLDPHADYRIRNHIYKFPTSGERLTLADDGKTVYVLVDGKEITRITMRGARDYPDHLQRVQPSVKFAATATITLRDGTTTTVTDTLVAASCISECGVAIRGGSVYFTDLNMIPFSEANISRAR